MKTVDKIQRAHDLVQGIVLGEVPSPFVDSDFDFLICMHNVLCWVLEHEPTMSGVQHNLDMAEDWLRENGFVLEKEPPQDNTHLN